MVLNFTILIIVTIILCLAVYLDYKYSGGEIREKRRKKRKNGK